MSLSYMESEKNKILKTQEVRKIKSWKNKISIFSSFFGIFDKNLN